MNKNELQTIVDIIETSSIDVLHLEKDDFKLYYQKQGATPFQKINNDLDFPEIHTEEAEETFKDKTSSISGIKEITSPMIGTFYNSAEAENGPLIKIGSTVKKEDTVCMIEAMKLFNEVHSEYNGEIIEILSRDGETVEYGQPLFKVKVSV